MNIERELTGVPGCKCPLHCETGWGVFILLFSWKVQNSWFIRMSSIINELQYAMYVYVTATMLHRL